MLYESAEDYGAKRSELEWTSTVCCTSPRKTTERSEVSVWATSPIVVGHRGGRGEGWPQENTLAAFERARREGARAIELDVRTCAGGNAVVFHDVTLSRATDGR